MRTHRALLLTEAMSGPFGARQAVLRRLTAIADAFFLKRTLTMSAEMMPVATALLVHMAAIKCVF